MCAPVIPCLLILTLIAASATAPPGLATDRPWAAIREERREQVARHLRAASSGYEWFADASHGENAGAPFLLLRLLPELAPDIWGPPEERPTR